MGNPIHHWKIDWVKGLELRIPCKGGEPPQVAALLACCKHPWQLASSADFPFLAHRFSRAL